MPSPAPLTFPVAEMTIHYADYPPEWTPLANDAADSSWQGSPMSRFAKGGRAGCKPVAIVVPKEHIEKMAKGGLAGQAKEVADAGVGGDTMIIHINRDEFEKLRSEWGDPTINPHTGMPQFTPFWKQSWFAPVAAIASIPLGAALAPVVGGALGIGAEATFLGANAAKVATGALLGAGTGALTGGGKGALLGGALGAAGPIAMNAITGSSGLFGSGTTNAAGESVLPSWLGGEATNTAKDAAALDATLGKGFTAENINLGANGAPAASTTTGGLTGMLSKPSFLLPAALLGASALGSMGGSKELPTSQATSTSTDPNLTKRLELSPLVRQRLAGPIDYYNYGSKPEQQYYEPTVNAATGGALSRYVQGGGTGRSDSIPAKLSDGEYVIDAETVSLLGDGSSKAGAQRLDQFRANIRKQKGRALAQGKFSPDAHAPERYLMGGRA